MTPMELASKGTALPMSGCRESVPELVSSRESGRDSW